MPRENANDFRIIAAWLIEVEIDPNFVVIDGWFSRKLTALPLLVRNLFPTVATAEHPTICSADRMTTNRSFIDRDVFGVVF